MAIEPVNREDLAAVFGVDVRSVANFVKEGMPKLARSRFDVGACVQWYVSRERDAARGARSLNELDLVRKRKAEIETRREQLALDKDLGAVIPLELHAQRLRERLETVDGTLKAIHRFQPDIKAAVTDEAADALCDRMQDEMRSELLGLKDTID